MAQDGLQDASKTAKMASKTAKMTQDGFQYVSKTAKMDSKTAQDAPKTA